MKKNKKMYKISLIASILTISLTLLLLFATFNYIKPATAKSIGIKIDNNLFIVNESLKGNLIFSINEGELYPNDSIINISLDGITKNLTLEEFVRIGNFSLEKYYGRFFVKTNEELNKLNLTGYGYGYPGKTLAKEKIIVKIKLKKINKSEERENISSFNESSKNISKENNETKLNNTESTTENQQSKSQSQFENESKNNQKENSEQSRINITGNVIMNINAYASKEEIEIKNEIELGNNFIYHISPKEYEIELINVTDIKGNPINKSIVSIEKDFEERKIKIKTKKIERVGFGKEFLGEKIKKFAFPLEKLNLKFNKTGIYEFKVRFYYRNITFNEDSIKIKVLSWKEYQEISNLTNKTDLTNISRGNTTYSNKTNLNLTNYSTIKIYDENGNLIKEIVAYSENIKLKIFKTDIIIENTSLKNSTDLKKDITGYVTKTTGSLPISEIYAKKLPPDLRIQIGEPSKKQIREGIKTEIFAIEPSPLINYSSITLKKYGEINAIIACKNWSIEKFKCNGEWELITTEFIDNGTHVNFNVTHFSALTGSVWAYPEWRYRRPIEVNISQNVTNFQLAINLTYDSNMQKDFSDIRFADTNGNKLAYWIENKVNGQWVWVWVKGNFTTLNGTQLYVYYGNTTIVSSESNISEVAEFYDDFETCDGSRWDSIDNVGNTGQGSYDFGNAYEGRCGFRIVDLSTLEVSEYTTVKSINLDTWYAKAYFNTNPTADNIKHHAAGILIGKDLDRYYWFVGVLNQGSSNAPYLAVWKTKLNTGDTLYSYKPITNWPKNTWFYLVVKKSGTSIKVEMYYTNGTLYDSANLTLPSGLINYFGVEGEMGSGQTGYINLDFVYLMKYTPFNISVGQKEIKIDKCITISSPGYYALTTNLTSNGTCININASNVVLDCQGHSINHSKTTAGKGIYVKNVQNVTIKNCEIIRANTSNEGYGIQFDHVQNSKIENNILKHDRYSIHLYFSDYNLINNNTIEDFYYFGIGGGYADYNNITNNNISKGKYACSAGIRLDVSTNNLLINNSLSNSYCGIFLYANANNNTFINTYMVETGRIDLTTNANNNFFENLYLNTSKNVWGFYIYSSSNNTVKDAVINTGSDDVMFNGNSGDLYFINVSFNKSEVSYYSGNANGTLWVKWYLDAIVKNKQNQPVSNANVTGYDKNNNVAFSELTNSSGQITRQNLTEFMQNSSGKFFYTNYTIITKAIGYANKIIALNLTKSKFITITLNRPPTKPQLFSPIDNAHTYNRTPTFIWNSSSDADGDKITYILEIKCFYTGICVNPPCPCYPPDNRTIENITITNYTLATNLKNFWDTQEYYTWRIVAFDGEDKNYSDVRNLYIDALVAINLTNKKINFGTMQLNEVNDTTDNSPLPLIIKNIGNCFVNIELNATPLWENASFPSNYYQFKSDFHEQNSFNWSNSTTQWTNISNNNWGIGQLNYSNASNEAEIDIKIKVPPYEIPGTKNSIINLIASFVDVIE